MTRKSTWTNADGLIVGFGPNTPELTGAGTSEDIHCSKSALVKFSWSDLNKGSAIKVPMPAGTRVLDVRLVVDVGFTSTGTNTVSVGDATTAGGFITTSAATTTTMATAGAVINSDGVYVKGDTDATAAELKLYASATDIVIASAQTDWTAGSATVLVTYL